MDKGLQERLARIDKQIESLYGAEEKYLSLDAAKEHVLAVLTVAASGSSEAAKKTQALATLDWKLFKEGLALAEASFHKEKHRLELRFKSYDAAHLSLKVESDTIKKQK